MVDLDTKVLALVERELKKDPDARSTSLQEKALKVDKSVGALTGRQFHARFALQARRKLFGGKRSSTRTRQRTKATNHTSKPAQALVADSYEERKAALDAAMTAAFERAIQADSLQRVNKLFATLDQQTRELGKV